MASLSCVFTLTYSFTLTLQSAVLGSSNEVAYQQQGFILYGAGRKTFRDQRTKAI